MRDLCREREDVLPNVPDEEIRAAAERVAAAMELGG
jgi:hypothetical protein